MMKLASSTLRWALTLLCGLQGLQAATYFVDQANPAASDTNPGTESQPWATVQRGVNASAAGDTIVVKSGTYDERVLVNRGGRTGAPLTLLSAPRRTAKILHGFSITANFVRIEGFEITHDVGGWQGGGIWMQAHNLELFDNYIHDVPGQGISSSWSGSGLWDNVQVVGNRIYMCGKGIVASGRQWLVESNEVERLIYGNEDQDYSRAFGDGIIFRGNHFWGTRTNEIAGGSHVDGLQSFSDNGKILTNCLIENNVFEDFDEGLMLEGPGMGSITLKNNVLACRSWGGSWGVCMRNNSNGVFNLLNNTFISLAESMTTGDVAGEAGAQIILKNNIFYTGGLYNSYVSSVTAVNNLIWVPPSKVIAPGKYSGDLRTADSPFMDIVGGDFRPRPNSAARNAGTALPLDVPIDLTGLGRPQETGWDVGAYEFQATSDSVVACITASSVEGYAPLAVQFDASASFTGSGTITAYSWSFGDGARTQGVTASHSFASGVFNVNLTVTNSLGLSNSQTVAVNVLPAAEPGLVLYLNCDDNATDLSGRTNNASWVGSPSYSVGRRLSGLLGDGSTGGAYAKLPHRVGLDGMPTMTLAMWAKKATPTTSGVLCVKHVTYRIALSSSGIDGYVYSSLGGSANLSATVANQNTDWHFYCLTVDGNNASLYFDGVRVALTSFVPPVVNQPSREIFLGKDPWGSCWAGGIDEIRLYERCLTELEIQTLFANVLPQFKPAVPNGLVQR